MCACKASILTGRARRGLFETSQNLVAEHLLSVSAPVATYLVVLGARSTACFCRVFSELRMPIFCHHTPPSCCHLHSERSTMHPNRVYVNQPSQPKTAFSYRNIRKPRTESPTKAPLPPTSKTHQGAWGGVAVLWGLSKNAKSRELRERRRRRRPAPTGADRRRPAPTAAGGESRHANAPHTPTVHSG